MQFDNVNRLHCGILSLPFIKTTIMNHPTVTAVYNLIILDESGSMQSIKQPTINGFNEIIQSIRHDAKQTAEVAQWINFYSFNGAGIKEILPLGRVEELPLLSEESYQPDHMTPLYDAIGYACSKLRFAIEKANNYSVLVTILTDGEENASKEFDHNGVSRLIAALKEKGWVFTYIGANHDVKKVALSMNISNSMSFESNLMGTESMMQENMSSRKRYMDKIRSGAPPKDLSEKFFDKD